MQDDFDVDGAIEAEDGQLGLQRKGRGIHVPINGERNSLQFSARTSMVETTAEKKEGEGEARIMALRGRLSRYVKDLEMQPGWHQLPNGIVAYSDPVAMSLTDPRGQIESTWKSRMTLVKENDGMWSQLENIDDFTNLGDTAFRKIGTGSARSPSLRPRSWRIIGSVSPKCQ